MMTAAAPTCAYCGSPFRRETESVSVPSGLVLRNKAEVQRHSNQIVTSVSYKYDTVIELDENEDSYRANDPKTKRASSYNVWDGKSYILGYGGNRFCKAVCAEHFARCAYEAGYRMTNR